MLGLNTIAAGFQVQRPWTDFYPNCDFHEAMLNTSFDWNGAREPYILATENDVLNGLGVHEILDAILTLITLDTYADRTVSLMELTPSDFGRIATPIWDEYKSIVAKYDDRGEAAFDNIERFAFYEKARSCYLIIATGESAVR